MTNSAWGWCVLLRAFSEQCFICRLHQEAGGRKRCTRGCTSWQKSDKSSLLGRAGYGICGLHSFIAFVHSPVLLQRGACLQPREWYGFILAQVKSEVLFKAAFKLCLGDETLPPAVCSAAGDLRDFPPALPRASKLPVCFYSKFFEPKPRWSIYKYLSTENQQLRNWEWEAVLKTSSRHAD